MVECVFNYKTLPNSNSRYLYPLAKIILKFEDKERVLFPIIDSGANVSILPMTLGQDLGIDFEGDPEPVDGVLGTFLGYAHYVTIKLGDDELPIKALFLQPHAIKGDPYPLLGRLGIFDKYDVLFQERNNKVIFTKKVFK